MYDPDNLEKYIYEADFDISQFKKNFLDDSEEKVRKINYLKTLKSKYFSQKLYDYTVNEDVIYNINCDDEKKDSVLILHRIVLEGDSNCLLKFSWFKSNDKWVFIAFSRTYPGGFD